MAQDNQVVIDFVGNTDQLQKSLQDVDKQVIKTGKDYETAFAEVNKANQQAEQGTKQLATNLHDLNKVVANGAIKEYSKDLQGAVEKLYDQGKVTEALIQKYGTATGALKAMQKELATMAALGQNGTKQFKELAKATAELQDTIGDTRGEIKKLASDTRVFDTLVEGARGMAAGFSLVTGTMAALGSENENVQKTLLKVQGAMAALQGVQELAKIATEEGGIATQIATASQAAYAFVVGTSTGAMKLFRLALAGTGIGLAVIAITELVLHWDELNEKVRDFLGLAAKEKVVNDEVAKSRIENFKQIKGIYEEEINLKKSKGEDTRKLELQRIKNELDILESERKIYGANNEYYKFYADEKTKLLIEKNKVEKQIKDEADKRDKELQKANAEADKAYFDELLKRSDAEWEELKKQRDDRWNKEIKDYREHIAALAQIKGNNEDRIKFEEDYYNHLAEIQTAFETMSFEDFQEWEKKKREEWKISEDAKLKQLHEIGVAQDKKAKEELDLQKSVATASIKFAEELSNSLFNIQNDRINQEYEEGIKLLEKKKTKELENKNLTDGQKAAIDEKYAKQEAALKLKQWKAEQQAKQEQAIINGALAITTLMASAPPVILAAPNPAFFVGLASIIASTALQVGLIAGAKPPAFAKGTEYVEQGNAPSGVDTVHARLNIGERVVPTEINKQLAGIKNEDLPKLLQAAYYPPMPHAPEMSGLNAVIVKQDIDYKKLGKVIAEELRANPQTHINIDKGGFSLHLLEKGKKVQSLNNRYES